MTNIARLRDFVTSMTDVVNRHGDDEAAVLEQGRTLLGDLISHPVIPNLWDRSA